MILHDSHAPAYRDPIGPVPAGGRLTVRERVEALVDKGSFHEVGAIAGRADYDAKGDLRAFTPSNCVMGRATVDGRPVVVVGDDFTVRGGSADATIREKPIMAERMAAELRLPIIRLIEGSGGGGSLAIRIQVMPMTRNIASIPPKSGWRASSGPRMTSFGSFCSTST